jgi:hypothetical protein
MALARETIISALVSALDPLPFVNAVWQGGAAAFNRVDQWSDIDLVVDAADERADEVWPVIDRTMETLGSVELCFKIPQPPLGIHSQRFYQLKEAGPFLLVDIAVFRASTPNKLLDPATHGNAIVHFDRSGATKVASGDPAQHADELRARVQAISVMFPLFQSLTLKELNRGNALEALSFYHGYTLRPLVELLRIKHAPSRYAFHTRYIHYDLPGEVLERLMQLYFVRDLADLSRRREQAEQWANTLLSELQTQTR